MIVKETTFSCILNSKVKVHVLYVLAHENIVKNDAMSGF